MPLQRSGESVLARGYRWLFSQDGRSARKSSAFNKYIDWRLSRIPELRDFDAETRRSILYDVRDRLLPDRRVLLARILVLVNAVSTGVVVAFITVWFAQGLRFPRSLWIALLVAFAATRAVGLFARRLALGPFRRRVREVVAERVGSTDP